MTEKLNTIVSLRCRFLLRREIEKAIADGYTYFIFSFVDGAEQLFVRIVNVKLKIFVGYFKYYLILWIYQME